MWVFRTQIATAGDLAFYEIRIPLDCNTDCRGLGSIAKVGGDGSGKQESFGDSAIDG